MLILCLLSRFGVLHSMSTVWKIARLQGTDVPGCMQFSSDVPTLGGVITLEDCLDIPHCGH